MPSAQAVFLTRQSTRTLRDKATQRRLCHTLGSLQAWPNVERPFFNLNYFRSVHLSSTSAKFRRLAGMEIVACSHNFQSRNAKNLNQTPWLAR